MIPYEIPHFLERLDKEFVTLIKQRKLNWPITCTDELAILANRQTKTIQKREKIKAAKIMNSRVM